MTLDDYELFQFFGGSPQPVVEEEQERKIFVGSGEDVCIDSTTGEPVYEFA